MPSVTLPVSPELGLRIQAFIDAGKYPSAVDVVRAALDALEVQSADREAIQAGIDDFDAGRCRPFAEFAATFESRKGVE